MTLLCHAEVPTSDLVDIKGNPASVHPCGAPFVEIGEDITETLVGYGIGTCGEIHDPNCMTRSAWCRDGHRTQIALRRTCTACDWKGRETCGCFEGNALDAWPDLPIREARRKP